MSIETYEQILEVSEIDASIKEAESEYRDGINLLDAREALTSLRRKYFE